MSLPAAEAIERQVRDALAEDVGTGDLTAALVPEGELVARVIAREPSVLCGSAWFSEVFRQLDTAIRIDWKQLDGDSLVAGQAVCVLRGSARSLLTGERTALNFLQTLSGTATRAGEFVAAIGDSGATILDTRKTLPGMRMAQKYAVRCGGARNHRIGLFDAVLIKENHIRAAGSIAAALHAARTRVGNGVMIEIEVENLDELEQALAGGARRILLDNFDVQMLHDAVATTQGEAQLEASGGVNLGTVGAIARTGVDFISVGELTKDVRAIDFSMLFGAS